MRGGRTETCVFSEYRIYPGHGSRFVRKDGQVRCPWARRWRARVLTGGTPLGSCTSS